MPSRSKTSYMELSLSQCQNVATPGLHGSAGEGGEGKELGAMQQPLQGDVAGEGFALKCSIGFS